MQNIALKTSFITLSLALSACGGGGNTSTPTTPTTPVTTDTIVPTVSFSPATLTLTSGETGASTLTATDNVGVTSGPTVSCDNGGGFDDNVFTAPTVSAVTTSICTATASDAAGNNGSATLTVTVNPPAATTTFINLTINLDALNNYANQPVPDYITKDNSGANPVTDAGATLGRVLFYDTALSTNDAISCASCHQQEHAFSDAAILSSGVNGDTLRHSMRLVNNRFSDETRYRWGEEANTINDQMTLPIKNFAEMGFSGTNGAPDMDDLIAKMAATDYYPRLFEFVFGDTQITEARIQDSLAEFVHSIQSFDTKYDEGRAQVNNNNANFPNFTDQENAGKRLFMQDFQFATDSLTIDGETFQVSRRTGGGLNCNTCHRAPEFDIDPRSDNNGFVVGNTQEAFDFTVTRSPTMRDLVKTNGQLNGPMLHAGQDDMAGMIDHYNFHPIEPSNNNLDRRMMPGGLPQWLDMTDEEREALTVFLQTLSGTAVYTDERWSDPFVRDEQ